MIEQKLESQKLQEENKFHCYKRKHLAKYFHFKKTVLSVIMYNTLLPNPSRNQTNINPLFPHQSFIQRRKTFFALRKKETYISNQRKQDVEY